MPLCPLLQAKVSVHIEPSCSRSALAVLSLSLPQMSSFYSESSEEQPLLPPMTVTAIQTRALVADSFRTHLSTGRRPFSARIASALYTTFAVGTTLTLLALREADCDKPLASWLVVEVCCLAVAECADWVGFWCPGTNCAGCAGLLVILGFLFEFAWQIIGNIWLYSSDDCSLALWTVCIVLVSVWYVKVTVLLLVSALLCLPTSLLIRLMRYSPFTARNPATEVTRTQAQLARLVDLPQAETEQECPICLVKMEKTAKVTRMPCSPRHVFHKDCIRAWLRIEADCPICKAKL